MLRLSIRHFRRHWPLNLITFLAVLMGAGLAAALPIYTQSVADLAVQDAIQQSTIAERNLSINGVVTPQTVAEVDEALGDLVLDRRQFSLARFPAIQQIFRPDETVEETHFSDLLFDTWSVDPLESEVVLVDGRWPRPVLSAGKPDPDNPDERPVIEVAIGSTVSEDIALGIGDRVQILRPPVDLEIVALVDPRDPNSDIWFGDSTLLRFKASRFVDAGANIDEMRIGALMPMASLETFFTDNKEWRYLLDHRLIDARNMANVRTQLLATSSQLGSATERFQTDLIDQLGRIQAESAQAQAALYLLLIQSLLAIIYMLALVTQFGIEQAQLTFGILKGRGFSRDQLTQMIALSSGIICFGFALPLAPLAAWLAMRVWSPAGPTLQMADIPRSSWQLATAVVLICWFMMALTAYVGTGRNLLDWLRQRARPVAAEKRSRQLVLELFILVAGGLAYWQLQSSAALLDSTTTSSLFGAGDPILLLAPTLLLLGIGLLALRLLPLFLSLIGNISKRSRSFLAPVSLLRLARDTTMPTRIILLITFTVALALFATVINVSLKQRQHDLAHYAAGADLRVHLASDRGAAAAETEQLMRLPAVRAASQVVRGDVALENETGASSLNAQFLAVDPATFPQVSVYPPNLSPFSLRTVVSILEADEGGVLLIVVGSNPQTDYLNRGDRLTLRIGRSQINAEVVGIIATFPTADQNYIVTSLPILATFSDLYDRTLTREHIHELWLDVVPEQQEEVLAVANALSPDQNRVRILGDAVAQTNRYQQGLISRETSAALRLNMIVLLILSAIGFLTIQYFATKQRFTELGVMQALGVDQKSWFSMVTAEAIMMLIIGILLGAALGTALAFMTRPLFDSLLSASIGSGSSISLIFPPGSIAMILGALLLVYSGTIASLKVLLRYTNFQRELRLSQE